MTEIDGLVTAVGNGELWVEVRPQTGCGRCHEPGGCGGGMRNGDGRVRHYRVSNAIGAGVGDRVLLVESQRARAIDLKDGAELWSLDAQDRRTLGVIDL